MTRPSPSDLIYRTNFEVHQTDEGLYWLGNTYQGDHCAPTDRLSKDMTADELRARFDSYITSGYTQTAWEHMYANFDGQYAYFEGFYPSNPVKHLSTGDWMFEVTIKLQTGEDFVAYMGRTPRSIDDGLEEEIVDEDAVLTDVRNEIGRFIKDYKEDPSHANFTQPYISDIKWLVVVKGLKQQRSYKVTCNYAVPYGSHVDMVKVINDDPICDPDLMSSLPL